MPGTSFSISMLECRARQVGFLIKAQEDLVYIWLDGS